MFSLTVNFDSDGEHPAMLSRFIYGVIHSFIHVGYGAEFGLLGVSAEGIPALRMFFHWADQLYE